MAQEKTLKQENLSYVRGYIVANILLFWLFADLKVYTLMQSVKPSFGEITDKIIESIVVSILLYIATVICSGLFTPNIKHILVFWRLKNPLPGCRAFSCIMHHDPRIDPSVLEQKHGTLPQSPEDENRLWYKIYKKHADEATVSEAQKYFLLMRELSSISFLSLVSFGTAGFFAFDNQQRWMIYMLILAATFLATAIAARNYGLGFVKNVLAVDSIQNKPQA